MRSRVELEEYKNWINYYSYHCQSPEQVREDESQDYKGSGGAQGHVPIELQGGHILIYDLFRSFRALLSFGGSLKIEELLSIFGNCSGTA